MGQRAFFFCADDRVQLDNARVPRPASMQISEIAFEN
jgi:hypothetical protein